MPESRERFADDAFHFLAPRDVGDDRQRERPTPRSHVTQCILTSRDQHGRVPTRAQRFRQRCPDARTRTSYHHDASAFGRVRFIRSSIGHPAA
jgi:hypothetical protein